MAEFKLYKERFNCEVWFTRLTKHQLLQLQQLGGEDDRPLLRRPTVTVQLQHRLREIYSVFGDLDEKDGPSEAVVHKKEKLLGRQLIHLEDGAAANDGIHCAKILGALFELEIEDSVFPWNPVVDQIMSLVRRPNLDHGAIIVVDFLRRKNYRCFEEIADSCC